MAERIEIFQYVIVDPEIGWCNSEESTEHGLVRYYPVNDGRDELIENKDGSPLVLSFINTLRSSTA